MLIKKVLLVITFYFFIYGTSYAEETVKCGPHVKGNLLIECAEKAFAGNPTIKGAEIVIRLTSKYGSFPHIIRDRFGKRALLLYPTSVFRPFRGWVIADAAGIDIDRNEIAAIEDNIYNIRIDLNIDNVRAQKDSKAFTMAFIGKVSTATLKKTFHGETEEFIRIMNPADAQQEETDRRTRIITETKVGILTQILDWIEKEEEIRKKREAAQK